MSGSSRTSLRSCTLADPAPRRARNMSNLGIVVRGPFGENGPLAPARVDVDCDEVAGLLHFVEADASDACYLAVHTPMVMAEEADEWLHRERWEERLLLMPLLTPGDFATVKRQALALDASLTPEEWLGQLEIECALKGRAADALADPGRRAAEMRALNA